MSIALYESTRFTKSEVTKDTMFTLWICSSQRLDYAVVVEASRPVVCRMSVTQVRLCRV